MAGVLISVLLSFHPVHVSLASVEYIPDSELVSVFVKVWEDDFILDYKLTFPDEISTDSLNISDLYRNRAEDYLNEKIQIIANDRKLTGDIENIDISGGEIRFNMKIILKKKVDSFTVRNLVMTELYEDQSNMLIFKSGEIEEGVKFTTDKKEHIFPVK